MRAGKKDLDDEDIKRAVELYESGLNVREVARQLHFNYDRTRKVLGENTKIRGRERRIEWVGDTHIKCSKCFEVKPLEEIVFNTNNSHHASGSFLSYCKACRAKQLRASREGKPVPMRSRISRLRSKCRIEGIECDLDAEYLVRLWDHQKGLCAYTREKMIDLQGYGRNPMAMSIDRVDCSKGYIKGNVVLCTTRANTIKHNQTLRELEEWMPVWYENLMGAWLVPE